MSRCCIVVTGPPCSGKSWVAERLAPSLGLPLLCKDLFKETLFDSLGCDPPLSDERINAASYDLLYAVLELFLGQGLSLLLESNFRPEWASERLRGLFAAHGYDCVQVHCDADPAELLRRFAARWQAGERHPGHADDQKVAQFRENAMARCYGPLVLDGPLFSLDTTCFECVDLDDLAQQVRQHIGSLSPPWCL